MMMQITHFPMKFRFGTQQRVITRQNDPVQPYLDRLKPIADTCLNGSYTAMKASLRQLTQELQQHQPDLTGEREFIGGTSVGALHEVVVGTLLTDKAPITDVTPRLTLALNEFEGGLSLQDKLRFKLLALALYLKGRHNGIAEGQRKLNELL